MEFEENNNLLILDPSGIDISGTGKIVIESTNSKITDNNSTNGIYINDILIKASTEIHSGDKIQIGKFLLLFTKV